MLTKFRKAPAGTAIRSTLADLQKSRRAGRDSERGDDRSQSFTAKPGTESAHEKTNAEALRSRVAAMTKQLTALQVELHSLNFRESQLASMQRDVDLAESRYRLMPTNWSRLALTTSSTRSGSRTHARAARPALSPSPAGRADLRPRLGFAVALLGSVGVALLAAMFDPASSG